MITRLVFLTLFLSSFALSSYSQEWFRGVYYEPMPAPNLDTLLFSGPGTSDLVSYEISSRTEAIHRVSGEPAHLTGENKAPGAEGAFPSQAAPGADDRNFGDLSLVSDAKLYPNRTAVKMYMTFPNGNNYVASGAMIDSRFVLTAGHCVYGKDEGGWATSVVIVPAYSNRDEPFGSAKATSMYSYTQWVSNEDFNWDIGFIRLDRYIGALSGWLGYGYNTSNNFIINNIWHNFSYPAESPYTGERMYFRTGTFDEVGSRVAYYKKPGFGGMSGSNVYQNTTGDRIAYLALSHTTNNVKVGCVRLEADMFNFIKNQKALATPNTVNISPLWARSSTKSLIAGCETISRVSFLVFNYSEASINQTVAFRVYLSTDPVIGTNDRLLKTQSVKVNLAPLDDAWVNIDNISVPANVSGGSYYVGVFIDLPDGLTSDNNTKGIDSDPVTIYPARLLTLTPAMDSLPAGAGCLTIQLNSNTSWSIEPDTPWIHSVSPSSGFGNEQIEICYEANTGARYRKGMLTVIGNCVQTQKITLVQHFAGIHVFPNPIFDRLKVTYALPEDSEVRISLYTTDGKAIRTFVDTKQPAGDYEIEDVLGDLPAGLYFMCMFTGGQVFTQKLVKV